MPTSPYVRLFCIDGALCDLNDAHSVGYLLPLPHNRQLSVFRPFYPDSIEAHASVEVFLTSLNGLQYTKFQRHDY